VAPAERLPSGRHLLSAGEDLPPPRRHPLVQRRGLEALDAGVPVEEITDIEAAPRINRIGVQEDYEEFVDELVDDESELQEKY